MAKEPSSVPRTTGLRASSRSAGSPESGRLWRQSGKLVQLTNGPKRPSLSMSSPSAQAGQARSTGSPAEAKR